MGHRVFLSHNSSDKPAVTEIKSKLEAEGIECWLDQHDLEAGDEWQSKLETALEEYTVCAVFCGPSGFGKWQYEEMRAAIALRVDGSDYIVIPILLPGFDRPRRSELPLFLRNLMWVEFRQSLGESEPLERLICRIQGKDYYRKVEIPEGSDVRPYQGLKAFQEGDSKFFFGREALTDWLVDDIRPRFKSGVENRFLGVIGASGSGKSSLVHAGVIPKIKDGAIEGSHDWQIIKLRPGSDPLESVAIALASNERLKDSIPSESELMSELMEHKETLHRKTKRALHDLDDGQRVLVYFDQFEEIFTLCKDEDKRAATISNLIYAATVPQGRTIVILTMRADFYGHCSAYPDLANLLQDRQELVGPMTPQELRRAIERPAQMVGCEFEGGLAEMLIDQVGEEPGRLPLLQHTLDQLWEKKHGRRLTIDEFNAIGQLDGALEKYADEVLGGYSKAEQEICRQVFMRLTQPGEGAEDTKRRTPLSELATVDEHQAAVIQKLVQELSDRRLLTADKEYVEVAHEALIRRWGKFRKWIDADRENVLIHRHLTRDSEEWMKENRLRDLLYRGSKLDRVEEWLNHYNVGLNPTEQSFVDESRKLRRQNKYMKGGIAGVIAGLLILVAVISTVMSTWAFDERANAEAQWAKGILRALVDHHSGTGDNNVPELNAVELEAMWEIASSDNERVREYCIDQILENKDLGNRFLGRSDVVLNSLVGLSAARKTRVLNKVNHFRSHSAPDHPNQEFAFELQARLQCNDADEQLAIARETLKFTSGRYGPYVELMESIASEFKNAEDLQMLCNDYVEHMRKLQPDDFYPVDSLASTLYDTLMALNNPKSAESFRSELEKLKISVKFSVEDGGGLVVIAPGPEPTLQDLILALDPSESDQRLFDHFERWELQMITSEVVRESHDFEASTIRELLSTIEQYLNTSGRWPEKGILTSIYLGLLEHESATETKSVKLKELLDSFMTSDVSQLSPVPTKNASPDEETTKKYEQAIAFGIVFRLLRNLRDFDSLSIDDILALKARFPDHTQQLQALIDPELDQNHVELVQQAYAKHFESYIDSTTLRERAHFSPTTAGRARAQLRFISEVASRCKYEELFYWISVCRSDEAVKLILKYTSPLVRDDQKLEPPEDAEIPFTADAISSYSYRPILTPRIIANLVGRIDDAGDDVAPLLRKIVEELRRPIDDVEPQEWERNLPPDYVVNGDRERWDKLLAEPLGPVEYAAEPEFGLWHEESRVVEALYYLFDKLAASHPAEVAEHEQEILDAAVGRLYQLYVDGTTYGGRAEVQALAAFVHRLGPVAENLDATEKSKRISSLIGHPGDFAQTYLLVALHGLLRNPNIPDAELINFLKYPYCVGFFRHVVLKELGSRYDQDFDSVWELVDYIEEHEPDLVPRLSEPVVRPLSEPPRPPE